MAQPRQSRALVIVNTDFRGGEGEVVRGTRRGAKREAEKLSRILSRLNYKVKLMHNKTAKEIEDLYQQERHREHGEYFVSVISSHGEEGVILGCDSAPVKLTRIFQILSSEKGLVLAQIPKIFFVQETASGLSQPLQAAAFLRRFAPSGPSPNRLPRCATLLGANIPAGRRGIGKAAFRSPSPARVGTANSRGRAGRNSAANW
ncbi:caspase-7-like isoform 2-T2 [Chlamydotis macqueenii]